MEQEEAQAALAKGLQLEKGDLDKLITEFEQTGTPRWLRYQSGPGSAHFH
jgi:hypothetical protein